MLTAAETMKVVRVEFHAWRSVVMEYAVDKTGTVRFQAVLGGGIGQCYAPFYFFKNIYRRSTPLKNKTMSRVNSPPFRFGYTRSVVFFTPTGGKALGRAHSTDQRAVYKCAFVQNDLKLLSVFRCARRVFRICFAITLSHFADGG